jgi:hypothetical protein
MTEPTRKPRFRLSLRMMMVVVLAIGGLLGWKINRARTQAEAVKLIKAADGEVFYDYQFNGTIENSAPKIDFTTKHRVPDWLRRITDDEMLQEVTSVSFQGGNPSSETWKAVSKLDHLVNLDFRLLDARLEHVQGLSSLPRLKSVTMGFQLQIEPATFDEFGSIAGLESFHANSWLSDDDLRRLAKARTLVEVQTSVKSGDKALVPLASLGRLKSITLKGGVSFTSQALKTLAPILPNLELLDLSPSFILDEGIADLSACRRLKSLTLDTISPTGLASLKDLKELVSLSLEDAAITDDALVNLQGLINLKTLNLGNSNISDAGLEHLVGLKKLEELTIAGGTVTDAGLIAIRKLPALKKLDIQEGWKVTPEALATIRQDLPNLVIVVPSSRFPRLSVTLPLPADVTGDEPAKPDAPKP